MNKFCTPPYLAEPQDIEGGGIDRGQKTEVRGRTPSGFCLLLQDATNKIPGRFYNCRVSYSVTVLIHN